MLHWELTQCRVRQAEWRSGLNCNPKALCRRVDETIAENKPGDEFTATLLDVAGSLQAFYTGARHHSHLLLLPPQETVFVVSGYRCAEGCLSGKTDGDLVTPET
jgi:hypothetical protein